MNDDTSVNQGLIATHNPELFLQLFDSPAWGPSPEMGDSGRSVKKIYAGVIEGEKIKAILWCTDILQED
jgi:hypothetical protein